jgi:aspartate kinase
MQQLLSDGNIVIAAGFQGIDDEFNITTLGRGGSDTTAVALAAVLGANSCEIYTDVDGVYTTDPRVLPEARRVLRVSYDEMLELASLGAGVMHSRSIEFAKKFHVPVHVRSSATDIPGTLIVADAEAPDMAVGGAAITKNEARIAVLDVPDKPGSSLEIFSPIAAKNISVDMIVQNVGTDGKADISFTVPTNELAATLEAVNAAAKAIGAREVTHDQNVSKVSVVGLGMAKQTGVADRMFRALADADVNIQMITTSEIKISVLVERDQAQTALREVHRAFHLDKTPKGAVSSIDQVHAETKRPADAATIIARLQGLNMEDLTIDDVSLDASQARITIQEVPDQPGVAAKVFEQVAAAGIFVDMIVQSYGGANNPVSIGFTVPAAKLDEAVAVAQKLATELKATGVTHSPKVAKLSVSGVGLRTHTGVAIRMFRSLAEAGINVEMINTSEVRVNVIIDGAKGEAGLKQLQAAFADVMR